MSGLSIFFARLNITVNPTFLLTLITLELHAIATIFVMGELIKWQCIIIIINSHFVKNCAKINLKKVFYYRTLKLNLILTSIVYCYEIDFMSSYPASLPRGS